MVQKGKFLRLLILLSLVKCSSVTIPTGEKDYALTSKPTYQERKAFYLVGLIGTATVDVNEVCKGKKVLQMQSIATFEDGLLGLVTLEIYSPKSVRVWCEL